jgi:hypothetical protein
MPDEKNRFPWWLLAVAGLPLAAVLGFIETVGRQGTLVGRFELVRTGMSFVEVVDALGSCPCVLDDRDQYWLDDPVDVKLRFEGKWRLDPNDWHVLDKRLRVNGAGSTWWRIRRWAEQAYTAIHGPRR